MVRRHAILYVILYVALTLCLVVESRAQESATPEAAKSAPEATTGGTPEAGQPAAPTATGDSANSSTGKTVESLGDKKTASSAKTPKKPKSEQATFGGGCFWHVEADFERLKGVNWAVSGYAGGIVPNPSYEMVHEGFTGHAEVVMVDFDPEVITYEDLLKVFWKIHDPTSINRQGPDEGPQYRSIILYHSEEQRQAALASYRTLTQQRVYRSPIVTQLVPMKAFFRAEDYHQNYYGGKPQPRTNTSARRRKTSLARTKKAAAKTGHAAVPAKPAASDSKDLSPNPRP